MVVGGSHGGWIGAHLTFQFPETFTLIILLNPVTDLLLNFHVSDIPDWSLFENNLAFDFEKPSLTLTLEKIKKMTAVNPASLPVQFFNVQQQSDGETAKNDILENSGKFPKTKIILGQKDARVPIPNGLRWHEFLLSKGLHSKAYILPDTGHALLGFEQEKATFIMVLGFIENSQN